MINLLEETLEVLKSNGKDVQEVLWCGSSTFGSFSWEDFAKVADVEYDDGEGSQKVAQDLIVCGKDWWLQRSEFDGSEWWDFYTLPTKPAANTLPLVALTIGQARELGFNVTCGWETLSRINGDKDG